MVFSVVFALRCCCCCSFGCCCYCCNSSPSFFFQICVHILCISVLLWRIVWWEAFLQTLFNMLYTMLLVILFMCLTILKCSVFTPNSVFCIAYIESKTKSNSNNNTRGKKNLMKLVLCLYQCMNWNWFMYC